MRPFPVLRSVVLIALALGLEISGLGLILDEPMSERNLMTRGFCHLMASAVAAYIFPKIIIPDQYESQRATGLFFFVLVFYLPVLGLMGLMLGMPLIAGWSSKRTQSSDSSVRVNKIRDLPSECRHARTAG